MLAAVFKDKFVYDYFNAALNENKFPQSIIFEGLDIFGQLHFALELARTVNCLEKSRSGFSNSGGYEIAQDCGCLNCRWIKEGKHPAVNLVSPIDFKCGDTGSKTVISVKQALGITQALEQTSDYHRVFILLDAKNQALSEIDRKNLEQYSHLGYTLPDEDWLPCSINHKIFQHTATNAILKAVEEPPARTTFIFLTNNREDLIPTIVSRSLVFKMPACKTDVPTGFIEDAFKNYPNISLFDAFEISTAMQEYLKEQNCEPKTVLVMLEEYLSKLMKKGMPIVKIKEDIKKIAVARRQLFASMSAKTVFDWLLIELSDGRCAR